MCVYNIYNICNNVGELHELEIVRTMDKQSCKKKNNKRRKKK